MISIDKLIVLIIALVVIAVSIILFATFVMPTGEGINLDSDIRSCCYLYKAYGCPDQDSGLWNEINCKTDATLNDLWVSSSLTEDQIKSLCNC